MHTPFAPSSAGASSACPAEVGHAAPAATSQETGPAIGAGTLSAALVHVPSHLPETA
jgi:hypothetical protein